MFYTTLKNRKLYFDGTSSYNPNMVLQLLPKYVINWVDYTTPIIDQYNKLANKNNKIRIKTECDNWDLSWNLPEQYQQLDIIEYVLDKHINITTGLDINEITLRDTRLILELNKYKQLDKLDVLKTIVYIVETLESHNIVYGIGRGSSVSSYVLYVIGLHDVDSFAFDLNIDDFFHD